MDIFSISKMLTGRFGTSHMVSTNSCKFGNVRVICYLNKLSECELIECYVSISTKNKSEASEEEITQKISGMIKDSVSDVAGALRKAGSSLENAKRAVVDCNGNDKIGDVFFQALMEKGLDI